MQLAISIEKPPQIFYMLQHNTFTKVVIVVMEGNFLRQITDICGEKKTKQNYRSRLKKN